MRLSPLAVMWALLCVASGCTSDDTYVDVYFEADELSFTDAVSLRVLVLSGDGTLQLDETKALSGLELPSGVRVVPRGDLGAEFSVVGRLLGRDSEVLQEARVRSRFVPGEGRQLWVRFTNVCTGVASCGPERTCRGGGCTGACADAQRVPVEDKPTPVYSCQTSDGGVDAGLDAPDLALDATADAGDAGALDAGDDAPPLPVPYVRVHVEENRQTSGRDWRPVRDGHATIPGDGRRWLLAITGQLGGANPPGGALRCVLNAGTEEETVLGEVSSLQRAPDDSGAPDTVRPGPFVLLDVLPASEVDTEVTVDFRGLAEMPSTGVVRDLLIVGVPLPDDALAMESRAANIDFPRTEFDDWAFTRDVSIPDGEHLVLIWAVAAAPIGSNGLQLRVDDGTGTYWPVRSENGSRPYMTTTPAEAQSLFIARHLTSAQPLQIQGKAQCRVEGCSDETASFDSFRVFVIDLSTFGSFRSHETHEESHHGTATWEPRDLVSFTPDRDSHYLVFQSMLAYGGNPHNSSSGRRGVRFLAGPLEHSFDHQYDWRENRIPYVLIDVVEAPADGSLEFSSAYSSPAADERIDTKESAIQVLGF